tara:strand:+ start:548 stop:958 length:411 start_codon:yes stop_codon:yes gene_type:complete
MYSVEQLQGILILSAVPKFQMTKVSNSRGWEPRYNIKLRLPEHLIEPVIRSLNHIQVEANLERERGRRVDTIIIRRRLEVLRICDIFPPNVPTKSKGWAVFIRLMEKVRNGEHMNEDSRYEFEMIINDEKERDKKT